MDVGNMDVSMPIAEIIGRATVSEHLPIHEISCMLKTRFIDNLRSFTFLL